MFELLLMAAEGGYETQRSVRDNIVIDWSLMGQIALNLLSILSLSAGLTFVFAGTIGVLRLPDFFTRLHAAGMTDTLGAELILLALIFQANKIDAVEPWQVVAKLLLVAFFLFVTSPTATHAVAHAAFRAGEKPVLGKWRANAPDDGEGA